MGAQLLLATNQRRRRLENADFGGMTGSMTRSSSTSTEGVQTTALPRFVPCHITPRNSIRTYDQLPLKFEGLTCPDRACTHHSWNFGCPNEQ